MPLPRETLMSRRRPPQAIGRPWLRGVLLMALMALLVCLPLMGGEPQSRFFDQLRARQLFGLAERYCLEKLAREDLPAGQRIDFAYELSRTFVQHALVAESEQQTELWDRSLQVLYQTRTAVGNHERKVLLDLQAGFVQCARGHALRWQSALTPDNGPIRLQARQMLAGGIEKLVQLDAELKVRLRKPAPKDVAPQDKFSPAEIRGLLLTTEFELGKAYFETANLQSDDDTDRLGTIQEAEKWLGAALNADRAGDIGQASQVLMAGCARLRIDANRALRLLDDLQSSEPPATINDLILAERARIFLMQLKPLEAADLLTENLKTRTDPPGELVSLRIEVLIKLWLAAEEKKAADLASELQRTIDEQLEKVRTTNPGYWATYCETLVTQARESRSLGTVLAEQVRKARGLYHAKKIPAALAAYSAAIDGAKKEGRDDLAFDLTYTRGSIEIEAGQFSAAAQTFKDLVAANPQHAKTPDAHFLAAYALGQIYAATATKQNRESYTNQLEAQRRLYPDHATSGEATWLLGQLEEKRLQNSAAIKLYQQVPATHPRASAAAAATGRCYDRLLQRLRELKQPIEAWETEAIERLTGLLPTDQAATLSEDQAVLALHLSNIVLQSQTPDFAGADRWLEWVTRSAPALPSGGKQKPATPAGQPAPLWPELTRAAARLRVVSLAGQGRIPEAEKTLTTLAASSPSELLAIIDGLSKLVAQAQTEPQHNLGELQLRVALNLKSQRDKLDPEDQQRLDRCVAEAYVAAGRYEQAIEPFKEQLKARPQDVTLLMGLAQLLMKFGKRDRTEEAQAIWKQIESRYKSGTAGWFEARYQFARCELELGNPEKALKLIGVTRVLFPQLGGAETSRKFQDLQTECEGRLAKPK